MHEQHKLTERELEREYQRATELWEIMLTLGDGVSLRNFLAEEQWFLDIASTDQRNHYEQQRAYVLVALGQDTRALLAFAQAVMGERTHDVAYLEEQAAAIKAQEAFPAWLRQVVAYEARAFRLARPTRNLAAARAESIRTIQRAGQRYPWLLKLLARVWAPRERYVYDEDDADPTL